MKQIVIAGVVTLCGALGSPLAWSADAPEAASGTAQVPATNAPVEADKVPGHLQPMAMVAMPPNCLQETGTHLQPKDGCIAAVNGRSYDREQITANRDLTLSGTLSRDPAVTIVNHR